MIAKLCGQRIAAITTKLAVNMIIEMVVHSVECQLFRVLLPAGINFDTSATRSGFDSRSVYSAS